MHVAPTTERKQSPQTGDPCAECDHGHLTVYSSCRRGNWVYQYFACWACGWRPVENKLAVSSESVPRRRPRKNRPNNVNSATT